MQAKDCLVGLRIWDKKMSKFGVIAAPDVYMDSALSYKEGTSALDIDGHVWYIPSVVTYPDQRHCVHPVYLDLV